MGFLSARNFMGPSEIKKPCEMMVSVTQSGVKDFAVAFPKGSKLRYVIAIKIIYYYVRCELSEYWFKESIANLKFCYNILMLFYIVLELDFSLVFINNLGYLNYKIIRFKS